MSATVEKLSVEDSRPAIKKTSRSCCIPTNNQKSLLTDKNIHAIAIIVVVNLTNIGLVTVKGYVAYATGSFSIANSTIESFGDVFVGALILVTRLQNRCCVGNDRYPRGRSSESLSNVIASVVMIVLACINGVISVDNFVADLFDPILNNKHLLVIAINIVLKAVLYLLCKLRGDVEQISVLCKDQRTDVLTNSVTFVFALATRYWSKYFDLVGAVIIFVTICLNWTPILCTNCNKINGIQPKVWRRDTVEEAIKESGLVSTVDELILFHNGEMCVVEVYAACKNEDIEGSRHILTESLMKIEWIRVAFVTLTPPRGVKEISQKEVEKSVEETEKDPVEEVRKEEREQLLDGEENV